jgi:hypothetical protein
MSPQGRRLGLQGFYSSWGYPLEQADQQTSHRGSLGVLGAIGVRGRHSRSDPFALNVSGYAQVPLGTAQDDTTNTTIYIIVYVTVIVDEYDLSSLS